MDSHFMIKNSQFLATKIKKKDMENHFNIKILYINDITGEDINSGFCFATAAKA